MLLSDWVFVIVMLVMSMSILIYANYDLHKQVKQHIEEEKERVATIDDKDE